MTANGVIVDRRGLLLIGAAGATLLSSSPAAAQTDDFRTLMQALEGLGDRLPATTPSEQNAHIYRVAARAMLVRDFPVPRMGAMGRSGVEIGPLGRTEPPADIVHGIALVFYRLAPGALLEAHNHPNYSVATIGVEGLARVEHYEPDGPTPPFDSRETFTVRKTAERTLRAGEATTLTSVRDNIHIFRAGPNGARFVDLFSLHGADVGFSYLDIEAQPISAVGDGHRARWIGQRPSNF